MDLERILLWITALIGGIPTVVLGIYKMFNHFYPFTIDLPRNVNAQYTYDDNKGIIDVTIYNEIGFRANISRDLGSVQIEISGIRINNSENCLEMINAGENRIKEFLNFKGIVPQDSGLGLRLIDKEIIRGRIRVKRWCKSSWFYITPLPEFRFEVVNKTK